MGPAVIKDRLSNRTYLVDINGSRKHLHADKISKYHIQIDEATCDTVTTGHENTKINHCAVILDEDRDFVSVDVIDTDQFQQPELLPSQRLDLTTVTSVTGTEDQTFGSVRQIFRVFLRKTWTMHCASA